MMRLFGGLTLAFALLLPAAAATMVEGVIQGYECGDNCYLILREAGGEERTGLCAAALCEPWNDVAEMPPQFIGRRVRATIEQGTQFDGSGTPMGEMDAFATLELLDGAGAEGEAKGPPRFSGGWFEISYPAGFRVRPTHPSPSDPKAYDAAFFISPDGDVEFYVFSPQWSGDPGADIALDPKVEQESDRKEQRQGNKRVRWVTIRAKDRSYTRSYVDTQDEETRLVFGIKYRDQAAYDRYRDAYKAFKGSLQQFAD